MCRELEPTSRRGAGGMILLHIFSEVIKKCGKWLWRRAGRVEGILLSCLPSLVSLGFREVHLLPPHTLLITASFLGLIQGHALIRKARDKEYRDCHLDQQTKPEKTFLFSFSALFFSSHLLLKKKKKAFALARHDLLCLNIPLSWWRVKQLKAMTEMAQQWGKLAKSQSSQCEWVLEFLPPRVSWQDI